MIDEHTAPDARRAWLQAMRTGQAMHARGQLRQAARAFRAAAALQPARMEGWANLGGALLDLDRPQQAVQVLEHARTLAPREPAVLLNLGRAYYLLGRDDAALAACQAALELSPDAGSCNRLGVILRGSWRLAEAEAAFRAALAQDDEHPLARVNLATLLMLMGRQGEAGPLLAAALGGLLPEVARREAERARLVLDEWQRLEPVLRQAFAHEDFEPLVAALDATPAALTAPDPVIDPLMTALAGSASARAAPAPADAWTVPPDWPLIEAHFALHRGDALHECRRTLSRQDDAGAAAADPALARYAQAIRWRRAGGLAALQARHPEAALRYCHWLILHGLDDAKYAPGLFKLQQNRIPASMDNPFASPDCVAGTIRRCYRDLLPALTHADARAALNYMLILATHCFTDGNGRVARFLLNHELERQGLPPVLFADASAGAWSAALRASRETRELGPLREQIRAARDFTRDYVASLTET